MRAISPGLHAPTFLAGDNDGSDPDDPRYVTPFQLGKENGRVCAITRWKFNDAERQQIANGGDLFLLQFLDDRAMPDQRMVIGSSE